MTIRVRPGIPAALAGCAVLPPALRSVPRAVLPAVSRAVLPAVLPAVLLALFLASTPSAADPGDPGPVGTAFTYQGRLTNAGAPAEGLYDFEFRLFDTLTGGIEFGDPVLVEDVPVSDGRFTAELDFGRTAFGGGAR